MIGLGRQETKVAILSDVHDSTWKLADSLQDVGQ
jgi:hypothetical protein